MIKFVVAALWLCAVTAGSIIYSFSMAAHKGDTESQPAYFGGLDYIKADMISVPDIQGAQVEGYFLARLVYTAEPDQLKRLTIPVQELLLDEVYSYIYSHPAIDPAELKSFDLEGFKTGIREAINKRVDSTLIHDVLIEQIDYLSKSEIRDNALRRRITPKKYLTTGQQKPSDQSAAEDENSDGH